MATAEVCCPEMVKQVNGCLSGVSWQFGANNQATLTGAADVAAANSSVPQTHLDTTARGHVTMQWYPAVT